MITRATMEVADRVLYREVGTWGEITPQVREITTLTIDLPSTSGWRAMADGHLVLRLTERERLACLPLGRRFSVSRGAPTRGTG